MKTLDYSSKVRRAGSCITKRKEDNGCSGTYEWLEGCVETPHGYVRVYSQCPGTPSAMTTMQFIHGGRVYHRGFPDTGYTERGLVRKANQFAKEIVGDASLKADTEYDLQ